MQEECQANVPWMGETNPMAAVETVPDAYSSSQDQAGVEKPVTDEQLMAEFKGGCADAFTALFLRYKQPLFGFFRRRVADPALAEELAQETFLAVLRASSRYEASALFRTWLYAIAFKILRGHRRKAAFRAMFHGEPVAGREPAVENGIVAQMLMREAVGKLDLIDREVLLLREFEQLRYAEIATVLGLPINTVRSRLFRARTALHCILAAPAPQSTINDFSGTEERV
jgi:RNA polymerase sigma factor (sigma-70 family)